MPRIQHDVERAAQLSIRARVWDAQLNVIEAVRRVHIAPVDFNGDNRLGRGRRRRVCVAGRLGRRRRTGGGRRT